MPSTAQPRAIDGRPAPSATGPGALVLLVAWAGFALMLVLGSSSIGMMDQGDYPRTVSRIVGEPMPVADAAPGAPVTRWSLREGLPRPNPSSGTASFLFAAAAAVSSSFQDRLDLKQIGFVAKTCWVLSLGLLAWAIGRRAGFGDKGLAGIAAVLLLVSFAAHNVAFLQSFYGEFSFFLGLPCLLAAVLWPGGRIRCLLMLVGLVLCAGAKAQYFYLPALVLAVVWLQARMQKQRVGVALAGVIVLSQIVCIAPLLVSDVMGFNRHHSTYLGSYLAMTVPELDRLGIAPAERACIGVDAWGNRLETLDATRFVAGNESCPGARQKSFADTLRPYAVAPAAAWRLATTGLSPHLTVKYFHVDRDNLYVVPLDRQPGAVARGLQAITDARDALLRPVGVAVVLLVALLAAGLAKRRQPDLAATVFLLVLVVVSQVAVSLLGEGIRDLSKHLAAAQYSLDLMVLMVACLIGQCVVRHRHLTEARVGQGPG